MDQSEALALVEEDVALLLADDGGSSSGGGPREPLWGLRFADSGEEIRFLIFVSVYALGACSDSPLALPAVDQPCMLL